MARASSRITFARKSARIKVRQERCCKYPTAVVDDGWRPRALVVRCGRRLVSRATSRANTRDSLRYSLMSSPLFFGRMRFVCPNRRAHLRSLPPRHRVILVLLRSASSCSDASISTYFRIMIPRSATPVAQRRTYGPNLVRKVSHDHHSHAERSSDVLGMADEI